MRLTPTEDELRAKYNPDLLKKSIETREERQQEFDDFVTRLKEYSKSDKPRLFWKREGDVTISLGTKRANGCVFLPNLVWIVVKEEEERRKKAVLEAAKVQQKEADARREEMRREAGLGSK
ncbi:Assembly factor cbp-4 [Metarhizium anisopliae]|nr:Assembly factor cbp-4 [Metarhizium anisopliae]